MTAVLALFVDAYRDLSSRKIFWIVLILSTLLAGFFSCIGLTQRGISLFGWEIPWFINATVVEPVVFYKFLFLNFGIERWLELPAAGLALVSTASIFPELVSSGAIDLYLSKPIGRVRLFTVKYLAGLIFVALQVGCFCLASYIVIGIRAGSWELGLFMAVPLMLVFFSYLFCVSVLVGVLTRSTIAAVLITIIFWGAVSIVHTVETTTLAELSAQQRRIVNLDRQIKANQQALRLLNTIATRPAATAPSPPSTHGVSGWSRFMPNFVRNFTVVDPSIDARRQRLESQLDSDQRLRDLISGVNLQYAHDIAYRIITFLPKTAETVDLLERELIARAGLSTAAEYNRLLDRRAYRAGGDEAVAADQLQSQLNQHSTEWILGTSLVFEAVVLVMAAWIFCRRDY